MNAESHVPSGVLISTVFSTTCCALTSEPAAAASPAATVIVTKSRRVSSSFDIFFDPLFLSVYFRTNLADARMVLLQVRDVLIDHRERRVRGPLGDDQR